jgi:hypothetical protein
MNTLRRTIALSLVFVMASFGVAGAQTTRTRARQNYYQIDQVLSRVESDTATFRNSLADAVNNSRIDDTRREQNLNTYVTDFVSATTQLRSRVNSRRAAAADVQYLLDRATLVDNFMRRNQLGYAEGEWARVRTDLQELAGLYGITWRQNAGAGRRYPPPYGTGAGTGAGGYGYNADRLLTGTYTLDASRSDDPRNSADQATRTLPWRDRQRVMNQVLGRLDPPNQIAIERRGSQVTIASTRAPQINFEADGRDRVETTSDGRTIRARASFTGDQLVVSTSGDRDSDFTVTFAPVENGRALEVTRRISDLNLRTPVTVRSYYTRTSEVAQFDVFRGGYQNDTASGQTTNSADFIIPDGATVVARLNTDLSTQNTREGDRFSMTVTSPMEYRDAVIEGHVSNVSRSGRVTGRSGMTFNFDRISLRDGRSYNFSGFVESVRNASGETVRVDNEGTVEENGSQTGRTAQRAAIGTAVGAIIGAIASGGKGAAIGAILGAGAGAGSVYVQGRDDLELLSGTEVTLRASSPRRVSQ